MPDNAKLVLKALAATTSAILIAAAGASFVGCANNNDSSSGASAITQVKGKTIDISAEDGQNSSYRVSTVSNDVVYDKTNNSDSILVTLKVENTGKSAGMLTDIASIYAMQGDINMSMSWLYDDEGNQIANEATGETIEPGESVEMKFSWLLSGYEEPVTLHVVNYWTGEEAGTFEYPVAESAEHKSASDSKTDKIKEQKENKTGAAGALSFEVPAGWFIVQNNIFSIDVTDSNTLFAVTLTQMSDVAPSAEAAQEKLIASYKESFGDEAEYNSGTKTISEIEWHYASFGKGFTAYANLKDGRVVEAKSETLSFEEAEAPLSFAIDTSGAEPSVARTTEDDLKNAVEADLAASNKAGE